MRDSFVPITNADRAGEDVRVPVSKEAVKDAPNVDADGELSDSEEATLARHYGFEYSQGRGTGDRGKTTGRDVSGPNTDTAMTRSEEQLRVNKTRRPSELVRLKKHIVTEQQQVSVPVEREELRVEREPITKANVGQAMKGPELSSEEHEMTLNEEQAVVDKKVVPKERVRLDKDVVTDEETVSEELRKERIDVERNSPRKPRK